MSKEPQDLRCQQGLSGGPDTPLSCAPEKDTETTRQRRDRDKEKQRDAEKDRQRQRDAEKDRQRQSCMETFNTDTMVSERERRQRTEDRGQREEA
jgi:hypothetical protein